MKKWDQKSQNRSSNDPVGRKSNNKGAKFQHRFLDRCIKTPNYSFKCAIELPKLGDLRFSFTKKPSLGLFYCDIMTS